jgi:exopolysaccharide production protein ExoQ
MRLSCPSIESPGRNWQPAMVISAKFARRLHILFVIVTLIMSTGAFLSLFINFDAPSEASEGSGVLKVFWGIVYLVTAVRVVARRKFIANVLRVNRPLAILVTLTFASALWSLDPGVTIHQSVGLLFGLLFAADISTTFSIKQQLQIVCIALVAVVTMSVVVQVAFPRVVPGSDLEGEAWHGVFARKNELGRIVCVTATAILPLVLRSRWKTLLTIGIAGVLTALSRSVSAMIYLVVMVGVTKAWSVAFLPPRLRTLIIACVLGTAGVATFFIGTSFNEITTMMGKDPHLTGRADLWSNALLAIEDRPLLGYGFQAFWGVDSQPARTVRQAAGWEDAPHAHNGYIDLTLSIGLVGLITYLTSAASSFRRATQYLFAGDDSYRRWPLSCLTLLSVYQISETTIMSGNTFFWLVFASVSLSLAIEERVPATDFAPQASLSRNALGRVR